MRIYYLLIAALSLITFLLQSCGQRESMQGTRSKVENEYQPTTVVKLIPVQFGGNRYVAEADFGLNKEVPLMVHGNANFYLMITHEIAEQLNHGKSIKKMREYGYSVKGMGRIDVARFQIGDRIFTGIKEAPVFDWPAEEGKAAQGMLGIHFLKKEKVRIDFDKEQMEIGVKESSTPDKELLDKGYALTKFFVEKGEGYMNVYFDAFKREIPITVGTVSDKYSFDIETFKTGIKLESTESTNQSPSGTAPKIFKNAGPIKYRIADQCFEIPEGKADLYSFAAYENLQQSELFPFGIFGRDWMKENHAIIDYANNILYFKSTRK